MIQIYNDRAVTGDFILKKDDYQIKVHLWVLVARCEYFRALIGTPMLEA
jgi:hypothetical protein